MPAPVTVCILAPAPDTGAGALARLLADGRRRVAEVVAERFGRAGAAEIRHVSGPGGEAFGARLRGIVATLETPGLVVLGAGALALATDEDAAAFVHGASGDAPRALTNSFFSADAVALACAAEALRAVPADLPTDNALPRWLAEVAGVPVHDLRERRDLAVDVDSPLDLLLLEHRLPGLPLPAAEDAAPVRERLAALRQLAQDASAELLVAGRVSAADLAAVERGSRARTRALVEERGLRTASLAAGRGIPNRRPPRSLLGALLDRDGPAALGAIVAEHADGALVDTRVLLAARSGADEGTWPEPEDRFASDLLLAGRVADPWLRALTRAAADAPVPVLLGAHTLVGPGLPLALGLGD